jgi:hypothetical protein
MVYCTFGAHVARIAKKKRCVFVLNFTLSLNLRSSGRSIIGGENLKTNVLSTFLHIATCV